MRTLTSIAGNTQRLDGGAMFGNAPKALWSRWLAPDEQNRVPLATRCLLVRDNERVILLEAGVGAFFQPKLRARYGIVEAEHLLLRSLDQAGVAPEDVDVVVLSHLHFDHAGGILTPWREDGRYELVFPRATFVVGREAWQRALHPHARDKASFVPEIPRLLGESGRLEIADGLVSDALGPGFRFHVSNGHTPGLLLTEITMPGGPVVYVSDLAPGAAWMHLPITMGYDRFPERLVDEKEQLLTDLLVRRGRLFFTHDPEVALVRVARDDRGRFVGVEAQAHLRDVDF